MRYIGDSWSKQKPLEVSNNPEALIIGTRVEGVKVVGITRVPGTNRWEFWGETRPSDEINDRPVKMYPKSTTLITNGI